MINNTNSTQRQVFLRGNRGSAGYIPSWSFREQAKRLSVLLIINQYLGGGQQTSMKKNIYFTVELLFKISRGLI